MKLQHLRLCRSLFSLVSLFHEHPLDEVVQAKHCKRFCFSKLNKAFRM